MENGKIMFDMAEAISAIGVTIMGLLYFLLKKFVKDWDERLKVLEVEVHELKEDLPKKYVYKQDYKNDLHELKTKINRIYEILIGKKQ